MTEVREDAYQSVREFVVSTVANPPSWDYLALYDDTGTEVTRISVSGDSRFSWTDIDGDNTVTIRGDIRGSDSDIPTGGTTITHAAVWDSSSGGRQITYKEQFGALTFNQDSDEMRVKHHIQIPQVL